jgi:putative transposase
MCPFLAHKCRIYPNEEQHSKLLFVKRQCRKVYNRFLEEYNKGEHGYLELQALLPSWKEDDKELLSVYAKVLQYELHRLFTNLKAVKERKSRGHEVGNLRFKGERWFKSFTYNQYGFKLMPKNDKFGLLHLAKIGDIPIRMHRPIMGVIKQVTIKQMASGEWYAYLIVEYGNNNPKIANIESAVGLDVGITSYIVDSDGNEVENPRHLKQALEKLRREQRRLSRKQKGSSNYAKQRIIVAQTYERVCNQRNDFQHKVSRAYVNNYDLIVTEKLNLGNMVIGRRLARSISDAAWSGLNQKLAYKAENAGKLFVQVDPRNTSIDCSGCGKHVPKSLGDRRHDCPHCGLSLSRDLNASINILHRGIEKVGQELPELACGHWTATSPNMVVQVRWLKQEASPARVGQFTCKKPHGLRAMSTSRTCNVSTVFPSRVSFFCTST